jgi:hypothetical protein
MKPKHPVVDVCNGGRNPAPGKKGGQRRRHKLKPMGSIKDHPVIIEIF